jgi:flagellar biosynthetic protein FlhB
MAGGNENTGEERNESATPFRREEFRKQGTVAVSKELLSVVVLCAVGISLYFGVSIIYQQFSMLSTRFFTFQKTEFGKPEILDLRFEILKSWSWMVLPILAVAVVSGMVACAAQVGLYVTWEPITPDWDRLNPLNGFKRLFSSKATIEALKALLKCGLAIWILWVFLKGQVGNAALFYHKTIPETTTLILQSLSSLFFRLLFAIGVLAIADYAFQRWQMEKQMKMSRREIKEEHKMREGDPMVKSRIRSIQRRIASRRMMDAVPKADVIVTNPTHLAVALKYTPGEMHAPKVVAKGAGIIAAKIREVARSHRIPIVENKPLARTLFKEIEINHYVPKELYKAVAEVLAYVYRLKNVNGLANGQ